MGRVLPILFNTDMVQAILDGRKTVTRRVMKPQPLYYTGRRYIFADECCPKKWEDCDNIIETYQYQPGDILYVRETWAFLPCVECMREGEECGRAKTTYEDSTCEAEGCFVYRAGHPHPDRVSWSPSIHMPKEAARIWLRVTDVRVERLQEITIGGCEKEGCWCGHNGDIFVFKALWDSTVKKDDLKSYGWDANPWVWVIEFKKCEKHMEVEGEKS